MIIIPRKVKCRACGKESTNDVAFKVTVNGKNIYYCSEDEYNEKRKENDNKTKCLETITGIFGVKMLPPVMVKKVNELRQFYDYIVIEKTFKECTDKISWALETKDFNSEFSKAKYIVSIVANNIDKVYKKYIKDLKDMERLFAKEEVVDIEMIDMNISRNTNNDNVSDISMFLD